MKWEVGTPALFLSLTHLFDPVQQGLQPIPVHLTVAVKEGQSGALGNVSTPHPGTDQTCIVNECPGGCHCCSRDQQDHIIIIQYFLEHPDTYIHHTPLSTHASSARWLSLPCRSLLRKHFTLGSLMSCLQSSAAKTKAMLSKQLRRDLIMSKLEGSGRWTYLLSPP